MKKCIPEMSVDSRLIYDRIKKAGVGEVITYRELSALIGRDLLPVRHLLQTAMRLAEREDALVFAAVHGIGIKRLDGTGILAVSESALESIGRKARRTDRKLGNVDYDGLNDADKIRHNTYRAVANVSMAATSKRALKRIAGRVEEARQTLPLAKTLEALKG